MFVKRHPYLASSQNPEKLSATIKSLLPLIILIAGALKLDISNTEIETLMLTIGAVGNGCVTLYYFARKFIK